MANVLNMEIITLEKEEGPAFGGAIVAAVGCGEFKDVYEAAELDVKKNKVYEPNAEIVNKYEDKYKKYTKIYPAIRGLF